ncbi:hypothetical protein Acr_13g0014960 [Actinidia rufa]|uniref:Uncharacterized protein n=1 Tax=Actinidia rufa TaxID=165716 RepID=A0A7J0FNW8_9ERIC|nr:hypothetical protein Acr_13g0014960 [Actinidia rufa]
MAETTKFSVTTALCVAISVALINGCHGHSPIPVPTEPVREFLSKCCELIETKQLRKFGSFEAQSIEFHMGETSRSRVTITLGGTGQVKRAGLPGPVLDSGFSESQLAVGSKRSVRERLGRDGDGFLLSNKRQRGESNKLTMHNDNGGDDMRLGKDDLRFKLIRKNMLGQVRGDIQRNGVDLRETLSRAAGHSTTSLSMRQRMPERADTRHLVPERNDAIIVSQYPSTRNADALFQMDSLRKSYSPWTLDQLRQRSPDRGLRTSRNLLPQRRNEDVTRRPLLRTYDDARAVSYMSTVPYMTKPTIAAASGKPLVPLPAPPPQLSGVVHKNSYTVQITYLDWFFFSFTCKFNCATAY